MPFLSSISPADVAVAILLAIPLGLAALALLLAAVVLTALAACAATKWALRRASEAVLGGPGEL